jgi:Flp pilus assembly protein TadG
MNIIKQKGTSTVEFAMLVPILLILIFMVSALGITFYRLNTVTKSVQVAARYLSDVCVYHSDTAKYCTTIEEDNARNLAVYGRTSDSGTVIVDGFTTANIVITEINDNLGNHHVQIVATYVSSLLIVGVILDELMQLIGGSTSTEFMTLSASSVMRFAQ